MARPTYGGSIPDQPQMGGYGQGNTGTGCLALLELMLTVLRNPRLLPTALHRATVDSFPERANIPATMAACRPATDSPSSTLWPSSSSV